MFTAPDPPLFFVISACQAFPRNSIRRAAVDLAVGLPLSAWGKMMLSSGKAAHGPGRGRGPLSPARPVAFFVTPQAPAERGRARQKKIATAAIGAAGGPGEPKRSALRLCPLRAGPQGPLWCLGHVSCRSSFVFSYKSAPLGGASSAESGAIVELPRPARVTAPGSSYRARLELPRPARARARAEARGPCADRYPVPAKVIENQLVKGSEAQRLPPPAAPGIKRGCFFFPVSRCADHVASLPSHGQGPQNR